MAIKFYEEAMKFTRINHQQWDILSSIAGEYEAMGDYDLAEEYWNKCREIEYTRITDDRPRRIAARAGYLYRRNRLEEAADTYEKALEELKDVKDNPMSLDKVKICARAVHCIISSHLWSGNYDAEKYYDKFKEVISRHLSSHTSFNVEEDAYFLSETAWEIYSEELLVNEALILIDSAIEIHPNPPANNYDRKAIMLERKNHYDEAIKYYDKAISIDSDEIFLKNKATCIKNYLHDKIVHNNIEAHDLDLINEVFDMLPES